MLKRSGIALIAALLIAPSVLAESVTSRLDFVGSFRWRIEDPAFGGFSAIEVKDDGEGFYALSDRSSLDPHGLRQVVVHTASLVRRARVAPWARCGTCRPR